MWAESGIIWYPADHSKTVAAKMKPIARQYRCSICRQKFTKHCRVSLRNALILYVHTCLPNKWNGTMVKQHLAEHDFSSAMFGRLLDISNVLDNGDQQLKSSYYSWHLCCIYVVLGWVLFWTSKLEVWIFIEWLACEVPSVQIWCVYVDRQPTIKFIDVKLWAFVYVDSVRVAAEMWAVLAWYGGWGEDVWRHRRNTDVCGTYCWLCRAVIWAA